MNRFWGVVTNVALGSACMALGLMTLGVVVLAGVSTWHTWVGLCH